LAGKVFAEDRVMSGFKYWVFSQRRGDNEHRFIFILQVKGQGETLTSNSN